MANRRRRQPSQQDNVNINPPPPTGRHPVYHGIRCRSGKWVSEIREPNKSTRIWLGTYPTPEMAAAAYDVAAFALKGSYAILNFPNSESDLSNMLPENPTADDIRAAAARAAAARAPAGGTSSSSAASQGGNNPPPAAAAAGDQFMDDEAVFGMPNMISDMAVGMLLSPPRITTSTPPRDYGDNYNSSGGGNLWDY